MPEKITKNDKLVEFDKVWVWQNGLQSATWIAKYEKMVYKMHQRLQIAIGLQKETVQSLLHIYTVLL